MSDSSPVSRQILSDPEKGRIAVLAFNNPATRNSMTLELAEAFEAELQALLAEETYVRALVITGAGGVFSSGGDFQLLKSFAEKDPEENKRFMLAFYRMFLDVRQLPFPVLAAVNGHAVGASLALALACDLRYFTPDAKYAFNFVKIGIHPGMGSSFLLREIGGLHNATELLLTGRYFNGEEALRRGLCHGLHPKDEVLDRTLEVAWEIAAAAPQAVRLCKRGLLQSPAPGFEQALEYEASSQAQNYASEDFREALRAIEEKRAPRFQDR